jgi:proton glutamate symport protein
MPETARFSLANTSKSVNRPSFIIAAVLIGIALGLMRFPFLQYLQQIGDLYVALLQMCVLPFLLATIPLAVRSALTSGTGGKLAGRLLIWLLITFFSVGLIAVVVPTMIFSLMPLDQGIASRIGTLVGASSDRVEIELALDPQLSAVSTTLGETGLLALVPANIFSALTSNDILPVVFFLVIFGIAMVLTERQAETSVFGTMKHIQTVCILIFDWFNVIAPIGIIALIAPQVARLGPDTYAILAPFVYAYFAANALFVVLPILVVAVVLGINPKIAFAKFLKPLALAAATRNTLVCAPAALETMKEELRAPPTACELYIPIGFAVIRFGNIIHFTIATLFLGYLMGRPFSGLELFLIATYSFMVSFATIGLNGLAGLAPMAAVLRPFGLSYELAWPLMAIVDPIASMVRAMVNVALNCQIPVLAAGRVAPSVSVAAAPAT